MDRPKEPATLIEVLLALTAAALVGIFGAVICQAVWTGLLRNL